MIENFWIARSHFTHRFREACNSRPRSITKVFSLGEFSEGDFPTHHLCTHKSSLITGKTSPLEKNGYRRTTCRRNPSQRKPGMRTDYKKRTITKGNPEIKAHHLAITQKYLGDKILFASPDVYPLPSVIAFTVLTHVTITCSVIIDKPPLPQ